MSDCKYPLCDCLVNPVTMKGCELIMPGPSIPFDKDRPPIKADLTAESARKLVAAAESLNGEYARQETQAVLKRIETAANKAEQSINMSIPWEHRDVIEKRLRKLGYKIEYNAGGFGDNGYYTISW